jgi:competence protein ComEC
LASAISVSVPTAFFLLVGGLILLGLVYFLSNKLLNPRFYFAFSSFLMFFLIGVSRLSLSKDIFSQSYYSKYLKKHNSLILEVNKTLKPSKNYNKYIVAIKQLNNKKVSGRLLLNIKKDSLSAPLGIGQFLFTEASVLGLPNPKNPFQFDYKSYLENQNIYKQIYVSNSELIPLKKHQKSIFSLAQNFRSSIIKSFSKKGLNGDELAVVKALLLGERHNISAELRQNYAGAGAMHILAISGLHIGIIMYLLSLLLKPLRFIKKGKNIELILIILFLWLYAIIAGLSPSIIRATTMFTALSIGLFSNRKTDTYNLLALSAFVLLLINPLYLFSVGFQMSYLAVLAIVAFQPKLAALWQPKLKGLSYFWQLLCVSTAAQIGVAPLSLYYFHQFPALFFLTNLVVIPLLGFILGLGLLLIVLAALHTLPQFLVLFYQQIIHYLNVFIAWVAHQEAFLFKDLSFSLAPMLMSYLAIIAFYNWAATKRQVFLLFFLGAILGVQGVLFYETYTSVQTNQFIVFNAYNKPLLTLKTGQQLRILTKGKPSNNILKPYLLGTRIKKVILDNKNHNIFMVGNKKVLVVDKEGVFEPVKKSNFVVLTASPKINLERLIKQLKPQLIVADNNNYKSFVKRWQKTCKQLNVSFYDVSKKGTFIYSF